MESELDWHQAKALLEWYVELGVTDAISETPINRYELEKSAPKPAVTPQPAQAPQAAPAPIEIVRTDWVAEAKARAATANDLETLAEVTKDFDGSPLKRGARNFVFADGNPAARVMIIGEAPGAEEDRSGLPFVGPSGQLLDKMFAAIGLDRTQDDAQKALYITNVLPWRPPANRQPDEAETNMFRPFLMRHIELAAPDIIVAMGNAACLALFERTGISRMRGNWSQILDRPALPMFHPSYLLKNPIAKREAWADLLSLQAKLREGS